MRTNADDPLNDILLPAYDLAVKIRDTTKVSKSRDKLLAGAFLVLMSERDTQMWLHRDLIRRYEEDRRYIGALEQELTAEARIRVKEWARHTIYGKETVVP